MAVQTRGSAQAGADVIDNSIQMINRIAEEMNGVSTVVTRLNSQSDSIDGMVETIRRFAMQTRLIALNAAIVHLFGNPVDHLNTVVDNTRACLCASPRLNGHVPGL